MLGPEEAAAAMAPRVAAGETVGMLFGRERYGLENHEVALADRIVTLPVNPAFASLNLAQAVVIVAYEWFKLTGTGQPFAMPVKSKPAPKEQLLAFFEMLERELAAVEFFRPAEKRDTMVINMRNIFTRMEPTRQDIQTLHGVIIAIAEGRKGPAKGGVLDGEEAERLRALLAEHGEGRVPNERGPVRGLARLLRRNPTEAEARAMGRAHQGPPLRGPGLQAPDTGRPADSGLRVVPAARDPRSRAASGKRGGRKDARRQARMALDARLSRDRGAGGRRGDGCREGAGRIGGGLSLVILPAESLRLDRLQRRCRAGAQEAHVACDRKEARAALGDGHRAVRAVAIGAGDLARLLRRRDDEIERAIDLSRQRIDALAAGDRDGEIGRPEEQGVDTRCAGDGVDVAERGSRLDHGEGDDRVVRAVKIVRLVGDARERGRAMRSPASLAERRELRRGDEGLGVGGRVDHRRDDPFGAEVERAADVSEVVDADTHDGRCAGLADRGDRRDGARDIPQAVLAVERDGDEALARDRLGDDGVGLGRTNRNRQFRRHGSGRRARSLAEP